MDPNILDKIAKLLAKKQSTSEHEAQVCAEMVQNLLMKYNLEMVDVNDHIKKKESAVKRLNINLNPITTNNDGEWAMNLIFNLAEVHLCTAIKINDGTRKGAAAIIGKEPNITIVCHLFDYLVPIIKKLQLESWNNYRGAEKKGTYKRGFYQGCTWRIIQRLKARMAEAQTENENFRALVVQTRSALDDFIKEAFSNLSERAPRKLSGVIGNINGQIAGDKIGLDKQVGNNVGQKLLN